MYRIFNRTSELPGRFIEVLYRFANKLEYGRGEDERLTAWQIAYDEGYRDGRTIDSYNVAKGDLIVNRDKISKNLIGIDGAITDVRG